MQGLGLGNNLPFESIDQPFRIPERLADRHLGKVNGGNKAMRMAGLVCDLYMPCRQSSMIFVTFARSL